MVFVGAGITAGVITTDAGLKTVVAGLTLSPAMLTGIGLLALYMVLPAQVRKDIRERFADLGELLKVIVESMKEIDIVKAFKAVPIAA